MLTAQKETTLVLASEVNKQDGPFLCPECLTDVIVKKGHVYIPHFAHVSTDVCPYGTGETELHRKAKVALYTSLQTCKHVHNVQLEHKLGNNRADVYFERHPL